MDASIYLLTGGFILVFTLITLAMTGFIPFLLWICVFGGVAPSATIVLYGVYRWSVERRLRALAEMARTYRRLNLDEFARRIGKSRMQMERDLARAIRHGYVKAFVDRTSDEFVVEEAIAQQVYLATCPMCGGRVDRWGFPEESFSCPYCNSGIRIPKAKPQ